jgi:hypothetical protein
MSDALHPTMLQQYEYTCNNMHKLPHATAGQVAADSWRILLESRMWVCGLDSAGWILDPVASCCVHDKEPPVL